MAQIAIREYDAKRMFAEYTHTSYTGVLIAGTSDFPSEIHVPHDTRFVIKPDQLFGKRGKYGLVGVNLDLENMKEWWQAKNNTTVNLKGQEGVLHTFLIEPFVPHTSEYYTAIKTERDHDILYFSETGGMDVEEHWESVREIQIPLGKNTPDLCTLFAETFGIMDSRISTFLEQLYHFFMEYGFAYLEVNPFTLDDTGSIVCLDMVARVDDAESFRQKSHWHDLVFPHPFGPEKTPAEQYIEKLDSETGASLKFRILHPEGALWLLTSGGGASVIIADTLADMGYAKEIGNYGECSGNPDRENTKAYTLTLLDTMLASPAERKYLIIAGAIANFTHIDKTFSGIIDALEARIELLKQQHITLLVRRGGINDVKGLSLLRDACERLGLDVEIADGNVYMTDILSNITL